MNIRTRVTAVPALAAKLPAPTSLLAATQVESGPFDDLGLPKLSVVQSPDGYTGIPAELAAGHYLLELSGEPPEMCPGSA